MAAEPTPNEVDKKIQDSFAPLTEEEKRRKKNAKKKAAKKRAKQAAQEGASAKSAKEALAAKEEFEKKMVEDMQDTVLRGGGKSSYAFWETQPVPGITDTVDVSKNEPIIPTYDEIKQEPYSLPEGYYWCELDVEDEKEMDEIYTLLNENYVEDDDNMFRFDYAIPFLQWALKPPGWKKLWHVGVRAQKKDRLVGFITAIPADIKVYNKETPMVEINFLCVHKKWREFRLAPVLIKEVTRRVHTQGRFQAVYTAGVVLPRPVGKCRYYHRSLNPKKLIDVGFSRLPQRMTMKMTIKLFAVPEEPSIPGFREMTSADVAQVTVLLNDYLSKTDLHQVFDEAEVAHWLLPREGIINAFVVEDPSSGKITDFCSFYTLPSTIIGNKKYSRLVAAYSYYNVATKTDLTTLMRNALTMAKQLGFDVFNALDLMDNAEFLSPLKFGIGDGNLQYYVYNWQCPAMPSDKVGLVLM